jgi:hypothetical protein
VASRLLSWIRDPHSPQILGDLSEEYGERARSQGAAAARRWYWRETIRNAAVLLWRKRIVGTTLIAVLAVLSVNILVNVLFLHADRILAIVGWRRHYPVRVLVYLDEWGMWWPVRFGFEFLCAPIVSLAMGYLFALAAPERAKHLRVAAAVLWILNCLWFTVWAFVWIHPRSQMLAPTVELHMKQEALLQFLARELTAAGAFFVGAGLVRRKDVVTQ